VGVKHATISNKGKENGIVSWPFAAKLQFELQVRVLFVDERRRRNSQIPGTTADNISLRW